MTLNLRQCEANTRAGARCKNNAVDRKNYCSFHLRQRRNRIVLFISAAFAIIFTIIGRVADIAGILSYFGINPPPNNSQAIAPNGIWEVGGDLKVPRYDFGVALLKNCHALVTGGRNTWTESVPLKTTEIFDPLTRQWTMSGDLNQARFGFGNIVVLQDGRVLIAGGTGTLGYEDISSSELYDPSVGKWTITGNLNTPRRGATLTLLDNGDVLIVGGRNGRPDYPGFVNSAELYKPSTGTWSYTGSLSNGRENHVAVRLVDGRVLVFGGESPWYTSSKSVEIYDPERGQWIRASDLDVAVRLPSTVLLPSGKVLVVGGWDGDKKYYSLVQIYDPETDKWTLGKPLHTARAGAGITLLNAVTIMVGGGINETGPLGSTEILDLNMNEWTVGPNMPQPQNAAQFLNIPGLGVLATGGWKGNPQTGALSSTEIYALHNPPDIKSIQACSSQ